MVRKYFTQLEEQINLFQNIISTYSIKTKYYNTYKGYISGKIIFIDDSQLSFREVKDTEFHKKDKYSYHFMNALGEIIFRYDNAYHHPEIKTFPHHKHLAESIIESIEPELTDILTEISEKINT